MEAAFVLTKPIVRAALLLAAWENPALLSANPVANCRTVRILELDERSIERRGCGLDDLEGGVRDARI